MSTALLLGAIALVGDRTDTTALLSWLWRLALVLAVWLIGWPVVEMFRAGAGSVSGTRPRR